MCGIVGMVASRPNAGGRSIIARMAGRIAHRGPDATGFWPVQDEPSPVQLGHLRLSIVDLAAGGQPMSNEDGRYWIIYNGELFNHNDLRPGLEAAGHVYRTHSDTETILHAFEEFGPRCVDSFRGMFAFAIWDRERQELFAARDRLGIKPFYYARAGGSVLFASEIKALLEHPDVPARPNTALLPEYLALGFHCGEETLFEGILSLPPGHWMRIRLGDSGKPQIEIERYWDAPAPEHAAPIGWEEAVEETYRRFEETVRMRLMADVPLGMFLSGGVDSSAIAAMIRRITGGPLKTFSVGYAEQEFSELGWARQVAGHIGSEHFEVQVSDDEFFAELPVLISHEDEPIAWPSSVALYFVSRLAREHVTVVLTGEGSDEIFGGYARYGHYLRASRLAAVWDRAPRRLRGAVAGQIASNPLLSAGLRRKLGHTPLGRESGFASLYLENFLSAFSRGEVAELAPGGPDPLALYTSHYDHNPDTSPLQRILYADQKTYLVELLRKQDRMSMACSIESRVPLLDHTFVEFAASLPASMKWDGQQGKAVFKKMATRLLPDSIVYRTKMGFPTPVRAWLRGKWRQPVEDLLLDPHGFCQQTLSAPAVTRIVERARSGREDTTDRIWRLLTLEMWGRRFFLGQEGGLRP